MKELGKFLGWVGFWAYFILFLNFFIKYINRKYIKKLPKDKKQYERVYKVFMKYIVKYHKLVGIIGVIAVVCHGYLMYKYKELSIPGLAAAVVMVATACLGIYGLKSRNMKGKWLVNHRLLAFFLIFLILFHIMFKKFLMV
ncbi:hypothetical protein [Clostridium ljungdahlii]|uniref:Uncharacterized protein n=1 Tax=Clostridium ljungdahlii TaxID=1538 RepID=A0A168R3Q6_9CLOT|nr:hypothetical protein [Clostridium ljungdahlii]OAA90004.1 hypothetical protein WY13_01593 [Clostridium ljungdahlii]